MSSNSDLFQFNEDELEFLRINEQKQQSLLSEYACKNSEGLREFNKNYEDKDCYLGRPCFVVDIEKILHNPFFSRCADKTQVFSLVKNDDVTRRSFHLQLVSRVGRTIGQALGLNLDLIEAIAIGHDLGHTPFGHKGEEYLSKLYYSHTKRYFNHNVQSVRLLKTMARTNLCLQTYSGILAHCGEKAFAKYKPKQISGFDEFNEIIEGCYKDQSEIRNLLPNTLEGCVVRISDIVAYLGKDRQDAARVKLTNFDIYDESNIIGSLNHQIIQNVTHNIIKRSIGKDYLAMDEEVFNALQALTNENWEYIYSSEEIKNRIKFVQPMMEILYETFLQDLKDGKEESPSFSHYVLHPMLHCDYTWELKNRPDDIVVDYIASMADDYFVDLFKHMFPENKLNDEVCYVPYFKEN